MNIIFIVSVKRPVIVLKTEFFIVRAEASANEAARDLEIMFFATRPDCKFRDEVRVLSKEE